MKRFLVAVAFGLMAIAAQAEASFDQIQTLIQQQNYSAAEKGLEEIIRNHPKSAKAFYAMAQAQAGLGNQDKARKALDIATGLNPTLDFAPASSVQSLRDAITPQVSKIEAIEESHAFRNFVLFVMFAGFGVAMYFLFTVYMRKQEEEAVKRGEEDAAALKRAEEWAERQEARRQAEEAQAAKEIAEYNAKQAAEAALKAHKNYGHERFDPENPDKLKSVAQFKKEQSAAAEKQRLFFEAQERREAQARADAAEARGRNYHTPAQTVAQPAPSTTVVNNSSGSDLLTGVLIGNMMSGSHHHHDTERTVIRETVREVPAKDSSWDDAPAKSSSRSSSWDDDSSSSSSKSSSSWDSSSSSSSSSSWDSGSSSSDSSSSSSSWD